MNGFIGRRRRGNDRGVAMVIVLVWGFAMVTLALVVSQGAINYIRPSDQAEKSFQAWAAAEAGVDDLRARLIAANGDVAPATSADTNPAIAGWVTMPGGTSDAEFTYNVNATKASASGRIVVTSTGRAGGQVRTVEAQIQKRQMFDYAYASMYETIAPRYPGDWISNSNKWTVADFEKYCGRYWYLIAPAGPSLTGHRDSAACLDKEASSWPIGKFYSFRGGPVHTSDVFTFETGTNAFTPSIFDGKVTSSCPESSSVSGQVYGCPTSNRWLNSSDITNYNAPFATTNPYPTWKIAYESPLEIRVEGRAVMKSAALRAGCIYTGPTRIVFNADGSFTVTSPDTKDADPPSANGITRDESVNCGHDTLKGDGSTIAAATTPKSVTVTQAMLGSNFNGVVYVQNLDSLSAGDPNAWGATTPPSCATKSTGTAFPAYPFVVLSANDPGFPVGAPLPGFPEVASGSPQSESFSENWRGSGDPCRKGVAYVEGFYKGRWSLVTEWDTALTSDIIDADLLALSPQRYPLRNRATYVSGDPATTGWGEPPSTSTNVMGLVPDRMLYIYGCTSNQGCLTTSRYSRDARLTNLVLNISTVITDGCLTLQDPTATGSGWGFITLTGSLGQKYRCPIQKPGGNGGFSNGMRIIYDARFKYMEPPPYVAELSAEPWKIVKIEEINTHITR